MSVYLVNDSTLVTIAIASNMTSYTTVVDIEAAASEATALLQANERALVERYGNRHGDVVTDRVIVVTAAQVRVVMTMKPENIIAAVRTLRNQASAWSGWRVSDARSFCDCAMTYAVDKLARRAGIELDEISGDRDDVFAAAA